MTSRETVAGSFQKAGRIRAAYAAYEEAGVVGRVRRDPLGSLSYEKPDRRHRRLHGPHVGVPGAATQAKMSANAGTNGYFPGRPPRNRYCEDHPTVGTRHDTVTSVRMPQNRTTRPPPF
jgi:hypothetical protein